MNPTIPFLIGGVVAFVVILAINARKQSNCTFDERQLAGRADAFKGGFFSLLIYVATSELTTILMDKEWITPDCNLALALSISAMTSHHRKEKICAQKHICRQSSPSQNRIDCSIRSAQLQADSPRKWIA